MNTQSNIDISLEGFDRIPTTKVKINIKDNILYRVLYVFSITCGLIYGLILLMFVCFQDSLLYQPERAISRVPVQSGHSFMNIVLKAKDGNKLNAWYIPSHQNNGTVLFCRGNKGNMSNDHDVIETWNKNGYNILTFDYRGFGSSEGIPTEDGIYQDSEAALKWLEDNRLTQKRFIIHGHSLGTSVAARLAAKYNCDGLVLESSFTSLKKLTKLKFPILPTSIICFSEYPTEKYLSSVTAPVYVIHSPENKKVPFQMGKNVYKVANEPKMFLLNETADFNFPSHSPRYATSLASFANSLNQN
ncbi:MAG: alpha/beta hydrolase [Lentisphaeraceae bacterium]|nr:alpha/beta hydrolase [Lentisphaeraceae bacterium]